MKLEVNRTNHCKQRDETPTKLLGGHGLQRGLTKREVARPSSHPPDMPQEQWQHWPWAHAVWGSSPYSSHPALVSSPVRARLLAPERKQQEQDLAFTLQTLSTHGVSSVSLTEPLMILMGASKWKIAAAMQTRGGSATQVLQLHLHGLSPTLSPQGAHQVQAWLITGDICA